ncbi:MAG: hypothetical protein AAFP84_21630, partial [Actinomycetota bacterium]
MTSPVRVEGAREVRKALRDANGNLDDLKAVHADAAEVVEDAVDPPYLTGRTAASVRSSGQASGGVVRAGFARLVWVPVIHFGWADHNIEPQPYLYDALDERRTQVVDVYRKG